MKKILVDPAADRQILDFRPLGFRDVAVLGRYEYTHAHRPLVQHSHGKMLEICLLESGRQNYIVEGKEYSLVGGDVFLVRPHEKHGSGSCPEEKGVLYWLLIHIPKSRQRFLSLSPTQGQTIARRLLQITPRHLKGNAALKNTLNGIFSVFNNKTDPLRIINLQNLLLRFLLDILRCAAQKTDKGPSPEIRQVLSYIDQHLFEMIPLPALADETNLSLSRFKIRFKKEIGIPPAQYIMRRKIERSKQLLSSGRYSVTDIAMQLGFSSSQYFSAVFKQYTGMTPSDLLRS
jgi:AraC-like DNA-binding protein